MNGEQNNKSVPCEFWTNSSCWKETVSELNYKWSVLMIPVEIMMCLFMIVGVTGNILVLVIYSNRRQRTSANIFVMFLACIDLFACVLLHPYIIYKLFNYYDQTWATTCKVFEYLIHCTLSVSGLTLLLVAIDRYLAICQPVRYLTFDKHVVKGIASITVISVVASLPMLEFYGATPYKSVEFNGELTVFQCHYTLYYQTSAIFTAYGAFVMCAFLSEIIIMVVLYKKVATIAYHRRKTVMPLSNAHILAGIKPPVSAETPVDQRNTHCTNLNSSSPCPSSSNTVNNLFMIENMSRGFKRRAMVSSVTSDELPSTSLGITGSSASGATDKNIPLETSRNSSDVRQMASRLKAAKILVFVTAVFFLSWMPFFIMRICDTVDSNYWNDQSASRFILQNLLNHVFYLNNAANPIIYTIINKQFRNDCKGVFQKYCRHCRS